MSIRLIAKDLYLLIKKVEDIEQKIEKSSSENQAALLDQLRDQLRKTKAERDQIKRMLEGCKNDIH